MQLIGFAIMVASYAWFAAAETLAQTNAPYIAGALGLGVYCLGSILAKRRNQ